MAIFRRPSPPLGSSRPDSASTMEPSLHDLPIDGAGRGGYNDRGEGGSRSAGGPGSAAGGNLKEPPRRSFDLPGAPPKARSAAEPAIADTRKLTVGKGISFSGEIAACDVLVVEGSVEARLRDGRAIEITGSGHFKGAVEIDDAEIAGRFEGELTVRHRLKIRATGHVSGAIRYGELEVEAGGRIVGDIQSTQPMEPATPRKIAPPISDPVEPPTALA